MTVPVSTTCLHVQHAHAFQCSGVPGIFWVSPSDAQPLPTAHYIHGIFWVLFLFLFFKYLFSSHAQPLLTVHYIITGFSECHLHMHSHYQMCTIFVGFSEFVLFFVLLKYAATTRCALYSMGFSEFLLRMHSHYRLRTIFMGFSDFSPSNTQPLPNVHYDMTFLNFSFTFTATTKCAYYTQWDFQTFSFAYASTAFMECPGFCLYKQGHYKLCTIFVGFSGLFSFFGT